MPTFFESEISTTLRQRGVNGAFRSLSLTFGAAELHFKLEGVSNLAQNIGVSRIPSLAFWKPPASGVGTAILTSTFQGPRCLAAEAIMSESSKTNQSSQGGKTKAEIYKQVTDDVSLEDPVSTCVMLMIVKKLSGSSRAAASCNSDERQVDIYHEEGRDPKASQSGNDSIGGDTSNNDRESQVIEGDKERG